MLSLLEWTFIILSSLASQIEMGNFVQEMQMPESVAC